MSHKILSLETLGELQHGLAGPTVDAAIQEALSDINQRPFVETARKIKIELEIKPIVGPSGELIGVQAGVVVDPKLPPMKLMAETLSVDITPDRDGKGIIHAVLNLPQTPLFSGENAGDGSHN
ncbi:MAG: hypothetical protein HC933_06540 [Pleurocapsa sp. SU_196_0]|nr:hypothetical protein [Pleurocapsa sp. SU_196_0]